MVSVFSIRSVSDEVLLRFAQQLTMLLRAGLPLVRSLNLLARQERPGSFKNTLDKLAQQVAAGDALSTALLREPNRFNPIFCRMIQAGESSGDLPAALEQWTAFLERSLRLRKKVRSASLYPCIVMAVAGLVLVLLTVFIIPRFEMTFQQTFQGQPLPALTQWVIALSTWFSGHMLGVLVSFVCLVLLSRYVRRSSAYRRFLDASLQRIPYLKTWMAKIAMARFSRTLSMLLAGGVPSPEALGFTQTVIDRRYWAKAVQEVRNRVHEGESLARAMRLQSAFPPVVLDMIAVGEASGQLIAMLHNIAVYYEEAVDDAITELTTILEPVMILLLALVIGVIVVALFAPIVGVMQNIGQLG